MWLPEVQVSSVKCRALAAHQMHRLRFKVRDKFVFTYLIFIIPALIFLHSLIVPYRHDWDLDAFLYLGSRLDAGKLLYFSDFETKMPLLQYIFWVPSYFGGIGAWRLITFMLSLLITFISSRLIVR